jgi:DNA-directed RNA polymerase subunit H (RpoH/RPB5)
MNYETIDILYRSRITLLDHLENSGYNTTPYRKFSPKEIMEMMKSGPINGAPPALQMTLQRKESVEPLGGEHSECLVVYTIGKIKQKLQGFTGNIVSADDGTFDSKKTELIIVTLEPIAPNFHTTSYDFFTRLGVKVRYFQAASIVNNPLKHVLVPKHERVPASEEKELLERLYAKKSQLPLIRFHEDPIARMLGIMPSEIVKITRPSLTAGECVGYRVCVP